MIQKIVIILFTILAINSTLFGARNEVPESIITSIKNGNSEELSKHFNTTLELTIEGKEQIYSNVQAELILRKFFKENKPLKCQVLHQSGKDARYAIILIETTSQKKFRLTLLIKQKEHKYLIHQLRID